MRKALAYALILPVIVACTARPVVHKDLLSPVSPVPTVTISSTGSPSPTSPSRGRETSGTH
jgi:hypothetical protein